MTKFFVVERILVNVDDGKETPEGWTMWMEKDGRQCLILWSQPSFDYCIDYTTHEFRGDLTFNVQWLDGVVMEFVYREKPQ